MKTVLCYGDSNTYGYNPANGLRYPKDVRWTGRLQKLLGEDYAVIEEGCNGRTTVFKAPGEEWKNGYDYLKPCLNTHKPVDAVILMLGSNDLKHIFRATAQEIADGVETLVKTIISFTEEKQGFVPKIVLVSPAAIGPDMASSPFSESFDETARPRSRQLPALYRAVAARHGCLFFNAAEYIESSRTDSLHLDTEAHAVLAEKLADIIRAVF